MTQDEDKKKRAWNAANGALSKVIPSVRRRATQALIAIVLALMCSIKWEVAL